MTKDSIPLSLAEWIKALIGCVRVCLSVCVKGSHLMGHVGSAKCQNMDTACFSIISVGVLHL